MKFILVYIMVGVLFPKYIYGNYIICAKKGLEDECETIKTQTGRNVSCKFYENDVDCILDIESGAASFGFVNPDVAILGSLSLKEVDVVAEIRPVTDQYSPWEYEIVVLVDADLKETVDFQRLEGLGLCHPGFDKFTVPVLTFNSIEEAILAKFRSTHPQEHGTIIERDVAHLSSFFKTACRPGKWSEDTIMDMELKSRHPELCRLCENASCNVDHSDPFMAAMDCFRKRHGHLVITTNHHAARYEGEKYYLCPNSSVSRVSCLWSVRYWPMIVANSKVATIVVDILESVFDKKLIAKNKNGAGTDTTPPEIISQFVYLLLPNVSDKVFTCKPIPLTNYELRTLANREVTYLARIENTPKNESIKWGVRGSNELEKCNWISRLAILYGLKPAITCINIGEKEGVTDIGRADIGVIRYPLALEENLVCLVETIPIRIDGIVIVIKKAYQFIKDVILLLKSLEALSKNHHINFNIFGKFRNDANLIFENGTIGFIEHCRVDKTKYHKSDRSKSPRRLEVLSNLIILFGGFVLSVLS